MNHKLKRKWVAALRGGNYHQCCGVLCSDQLEKECPMPHNLHWTGPVSYCVMGVLADVAGIPFPTSYGDYSTASALDKLLPHSVSAELIKFNDGEGQSFAQMADWIEVNVPETGFP
jgi:hypothetical protein